MSEPLARADFDPDRGHTLTVHGPDGPLVLRVDAIDDFGSADGSRFSVLLRGPAEPLLAQSTYRVETEAGRRADLFLVPVGRDAGSVRYEAAFNRDGG